MQAWVDTTHTRTRQNPTRTQAHRHRQAETETRTGGQTHANHPAPNTSNPRPRRTDGARGGTNIFPPPPTAAVTQAVLTITTWLSGSHACWFPSNLRNADPCRRAEAVFLEEVRGDIFAQTVINELPRACQCYSIGVQDPVRWQHEPC